MPPDTPIPSASELCLLKALWKRQPLSARELHLQVAQELAWSFSSTRKTLERMLDKHLVSQHDAGGIHVYSASVDKVATLAAFAHDFGRRVMELDSPMPVTMFTGSKLVDQRELAELEQLLQDWPTDEQE
ncbi:BlaI/MecI/CopY family transcriptional regulator [Duganella sp. FT3S]|uniref:BlaI/MecI/CopY family transcriptional regulator n=1 Tax=Rugamonas fusca TaxID=2758568 RepID=A0A7W2EFR8_9BURK|nr:BlaI/MecI/CopY family transcriptional regulator [Rugamonas fusca]MBA5605139.1 BlaI/MecI/CopY family transcriptional regulator [Rugamonas fusca]